MSTVEAGLLGYLLNSLWQLPLLFATGWLIARALRPAGPAAEHRVWVSTLILQALLPACPASPFGWLPGLPFWHTGAANSADPRISVSIGPGVTSGVLHLPPTLLTSIAVAYSLALAYFIGRLLWRSRALSALRKASTPVVLTGEPALCWQRCSTTFAVHNASLASSSRIFGPVTMGLRRRLVLLPTRMLAGLPDRDLQTVIAHEFAHMRRRDFAKNLLDELVALPVSYHPLLWLTRDRIVETREMICDQLAAEVTGQTNYARSLLRLAALLVSGASARTPHAIGIFDANTFERRLMRLTETSNPQRLGPRHILTIAAAITFGLGACCSALALRIGVDPTSTDTQKPSAGSVKVPAGVMAGNIKSRVNPVYPEAAKTAKVQGSVVLHAIIGKDGSIENLQVVSGPDELRRSAIDAVHQWIYQPYLLNGQAVDVETTITVNYSLQP